MSSSRPRPKIELPGATGATEAEFHELLQRRMVFLGMVGFWVTVAYEVLHRLIRVVWPDFSEVFAKTFAVSWVTLLDTVVFLAVWVGSRRRGASLSFLRGLDGGAMFAAALVFALAGLDRENIPSAYFPLANLLAFRAVILPSSARRTLVVSAVACLAVLGTACLYAALSPGQLAPGELSPGELSILALRCALSVVIATVVSHEIYELVRQVRDAKVLGQYHLEDPIGKGGMGEVYKARHMFLRRPTAIKLLRPEKAGEIRFARFEREVQLTSELTHPNTIAIYDYGHTQDGVFYYAMEYLPGLDLGDLVEEDGPQPPSRVIHLLRQACGSLVEAHHAGLVHRDIKPENLVLCVRGGIHDFIKVLDFGLVKDVSPNVVGGPRAALTGTNVILGTPHYLPPEALAGSDKVRPPGDLYALGGVGYFLLTGETPFSGDNFLEISMHHLNTEPETPSKRLGRPVPEDLERVILSCLAKEPEDRPASAEALDEALASCRDAGGWGQKEARAWWTRRGKP